MIELGFYQFIQKGQYAILLCLLCR